VLRWRVAASRVPASSWVTLSGAQVFPPRDSAQPAEPGPDHPEKLDRPADHANGSLYSSLEITGGGDSRHEFLQGIAGF
jgi:hypothetical protein